MSTSAEPHVVVIGAGECGARVAHELLTSGWPGQVTLVGEEERAPYERPPLSKSVLVAEVPVPVEPYRDGRLDAPRLALRTGSVALALDTSARTVTLDDGSVLAYDDLVLATGARPRRLPGLPQDTLTLRTYEDAIALRAALGGAQHLLVVGAGLIGLEVAASARTKGIEVTVVEAGPRALGRAVPAAVADLVVERHRAEGVDLRVETSVESCEPSPEGRWLARLSDGTWLVTDVVLQAVGATPETALAESAGLEVVDGIVVDEQQRASAPAVWAAGDCCAAPVPLLGTHQRLESWRMAHDQAVLVAAGIRGERGRSLPVPWFWSDQYDLTLQVAGLTAAAQQWLRRPSSDRQVVHLGLDTAGHLVCAAGVGSAAVAKEIRVAEKLLAKGVVLDPAELTDATVSLRSLLRR